MRDMKALIESDKSPVEVLKENTVLNDSSDFVKASKKFKDAQDTFKDEIESLKSRLSYINSKSSDPEIKKAATEYWGYLNGTLGFYLNKSMSLSRNIESSKKVLLTKNY